MNSIDQSDDVMDEPFEKPLILWCTPKNPKDWFFSKKSVKEEKVGKND